MVSKRVPWLVLLLAVQGAWATGGCTAGSEFEPPLCPLELPPIQKVKVVRNAVKSEAETNPAVRCGAFRLTPALVRRYLSQAKTTTANAAHHTLDWSPCYATGRLTFADGRSAEWSIDNLRSGSLTIEGAEPVTLYCPACGFKPFQ